MNGDAQASLDIAARNFFDSYLRGTLRDVVVLLHDAPVTGAVGRIARLCADAGAKTVLLRTDVSDSAWGAVENELCGLLPDEPMVLNFYATRYRSSDPPLSQLWLQEHLRWHIRDAGQYRLARDLTDQLFSVFFREPGDIISRRNSMLLAQLGKKTAFHITSPAGTDLHITLASDVWENCDGTPAHQYELPAGEVASKPLRADGVIVMDGAFNGTIPVGRKYGYMHDPCVRLVVRSGYIVEVDADVPGLRDDLMYCFFDEKGANRLAEFGIGTHPAIRSVPGLDYSWEERCVGPHLGFGIEVPGLRDDGSPNDTGHHLDLIMPSASVAADGELLDLLSLDRA